MSLLNDFQTLIDEGHPERVVYSNEDLVENTILWANRWTYTCRSIFRRDNEYVAVQYDEGATEYQDDEDFNIEIWPVLPVKRTVTQYDRL